MSHVNTEKTIAGVVKAGAVKMMDPAMGEMNMGSMMMDGMEPMMKGGMGAMMGAGMGSMMKNPGRVTGVVAYTGSGARKSVIRKIFTNPWVLFGLGVVAGCYVYKHRKSLISSSEKAQ
jgi:hypothetical protein